MAYTLDVRSVFTLDDDAFEALCWHNPEFKFEISAGGELVIMSPTGGETGNRNSELNAEFIIWNRKKKLGVVFDSSTCFRLPGGGKRSPDLAWILRARWEQLSPEDREKFPPIAPDFVLELLSPSDRRQDLQPKMQEYMASGVRLAWLIDRSERCVEIYRLGQPAEVLQNPERLQGEDVLPEFELDLSLVW